MRAIDADELKKCVLKWLPQDQCGQEEKEMPLETDICVSMLMEIDEQPTIQPEIVRCKDCQYWNKGSCECREHAVNCQDYYVGDIETEAEYFCGYAERREVTT